MNIDYYTGIEIDNTTWQLLEGELLDNTDPENAQYPSWFRHCDLIGIFDAGIQQTITSYISSMDKFSNRTNVYYYNDSEY